MRLPRLKRAVACSTIALRAEGPIVVSALAVPIASSLVEERVSGEATARLLFAPPAEATYGPIIVVAYWASPILVPDLPRAWCCPLASH